MILPTLRPTVARGDDAGGTRCTNGRNRRVLTGAVTDAPTEHRVLPQN